MAKDKADGFSSSAGLMRYFDSEDNKGIKLGPKVVVAIAVVFTVAILCLPVFWPM
ncbi:MAG: preprotein translocase subunit Sec61beta [archaeon]|nr:preprotein translocase subunit Sec61beta [archaeon]